MARCGICGSDPYEKTLPYDHAGAGPQYARDIFHANGHQPLTNAQKASVNQFAEYLNRPPLREIPRPS